MTSVLPRKPVGDSMDLEQVAGFEAASRRVSLSTSTGALRTDPIAGVSYRLTRPVSHHNGHLPRSFERTGVSRRRRSCR